MQCGLINVCLNAKIMQNATILVKLNYVMLLLNNSKYMIYKDNN